MGSTHHLIKFIPNSAENSEPVRPLLNKENTKTSNKLKCEQTHTTTFNKKNKTSKIIENKHFDVGKETRVKCDANNHEFGACLDQKTETM